MILSGEKEGRGPSGNCRSSVILLQASSSRDVTQRPWRLAGRPVPFGGWGGAVWRISLSLSGSQVCLCRVLLKAPATREGEGRRKLIPEEKKKMKSHCNELFLYF